MPVESGPVGRAEVRLYLFINMATSCCRYVDGHHNKPDDVTCSRGGTTAIVESGGLQETKGTYIT